MKHLHVLFASILALCVSGCLIPNPVPRSVETSYAVRGRLLDHTTQAPIAHAQVQFINRDETLVESQDDGMFNIDAVHEWIFLSVHTPCPVYYFPDVDRRHPLMLEINHPDYQSTDISIRPYLKNRAGGPVEVNTLYLTPKRN